MSALLFAVDSDFLGLIVEGKALDEAPFVTHLRYHVEWCEVSLERASSRGRSGGEGPAVPVVVS